MKMRTNLALRAQAGVADRVAARQDLRRVVSALNRFFNYLHNFDRYFGLLGEKKVILLTLKGIWHAGHGGSRSASTSLDHIRRERGLN